MKILSVDVETNGLLGAPFAVGAVVMETDTMTVLTSFQGQSNVLMPVETFVKESVLPNTKTLTFYESNAYLRTAFWNWYKQQGKPTVFVDVGYPVESHFFYLCQIEHGDMWGGPYPMHEIATLLFAAHIDPDIDRLEYAKDVMPRDVEWTKHNPLHDATVSAYVAAKVMRELFHPVNTNMSLDEVNP